MLIQLKNIDKSYGGIGTKLKVLSKFDLNIERGDMVAITGRSGCGKTTLLNIIAGLDTFDSGEYFYNNQKLNCNKIDIMTEFRRENIGFIVQNFALISRKSVYSNVALPLSIKIRNKKTIEKRVFELLKMLNIDTHASKYPSQLSGGECQRVAIARALANNPELILADEPTGSLDIDSQEEILNHLINLNKEFHKTIIIVTHDINVANKCKHIIDIS